MPPLPDDEPLRTAATGLRGLATTVEGERASAERQSADLAWISPIADRGRQFWSWGDGYARTGTAELQVAAGLLQRLADAVDELRASMAVAYRQASEDLQALARPDADGDRGLPMGVVRAELQSLTAPGDPYWSTVCAVPAVPIPPLPAASPDGAVPPPAPTGVVLTDPTRTRWLAAAWNTASVTIAAGRSRAAVTASALPLPLLDAYGLPGSRAGALLEDVLGPYAATGLAGARYQVAAEIALEAADAIDGLGETFMATVGGSFVGTAETAPGTVLEHFDLLDTAAEGGDSDGVVSLADLQAAAGDESLPAELRAAAQQLVDDPALFGLIEDMSAGGQPGVPYDKIRASDLQDFLELRDSTEAIYGAIPELVALSDHPNDTVTVDGLLLAVEQGTMDPEVLQAAQWLLDHELALGVLGLGESSRSSPYDSMPTMFSAENAIRVLINGHAFDGRPEQAQDFLDTLPVPVDGGAGLPLGMFSDAAVRSLANAALTAANGDLTEQVSAISRLPESDGGVRNALISAMYARMGADLDLVANGPLAGDPTQWGHSGANWMVMAPWASNGVRDPIIGEFSVGPVDAPYGVRQSAADGNQWIFHDIGMRYAAFLELHSTGAPPTAIEQQAFFDQHFDDGDAEIRSAFAAYSEVLRTEDPVARQELMFQGNVLIAIHEQAGAQGWLDQVSLGPDGIATEFIELQIGDRIIAVKDDLPALDTPNNLVQSRSLLDLDPGGRSPYDLAPQALAGVTLADISGVGDSDDDFPLSLAAMAEGGGGTTEPVYVAGSPFPAQFPVDNIPDSLAGTGASSWTDRDERMWSIIKLFEQTHTDRYLYEPERIEVGFDQPLNDWLDPATGLRP